MLFLRDRDKENFSFYPRDVACIADFSTINYSCSLRDILNIFDILLKLVQGHLPATNVVAKKGLGNEGVTLILTIRSFCKQE